jgi:hypothetical protein
LLDIREYNGQLALKAAGLYEEFRSLIQAEAEAQCILDKDANVLLYQADKGNGGRPEVPRARPTPCFARSMRCRSSIGGNASPE